MCLHLFLQQQFDFREPSRPRRLVSAARGRAPRAFTHSSRRPRARSPPLSPPRAPSFLPHPSRSSHSTVLASAIVPCASCTRSRSKSRRRGRRARAPSDDAPTRVQTSRTPSRARSMNRRAFVRVSPGRFHRDARAPSRGIRRMNRRSNQSSSPTDRPMNE